MSKTNYQTAADVFDGWRDDVLTGEPPTLYPVGTCELARIEVGPKLVTLSGGAPGFGHRPTTGTVGGSEQRNEPVVESTA